MEWLCSLCCVVILLFVVIRFLDFLFLVFSVLYLNVGMMIFIFVIDVQDFGQVGCVIYDKVDVVFEQGFVDIEGVFGYVCFMCIIMDQVLQCIIDYDNFVDIGMAVIIGLFVVCVVYGLIEFGICVCW